MSPSTLTEDRDTSSPKNVMALQCSVLIRKWINFQLLFVPLWTRLKSEELHNLLPAITICRANCTSRKEYSIFSFVNKVMQFSVKNLNSVLSRTSDLHYVKRTHE